MQTRRYNNPISRYPFWIFSLGRFSKMKNEGDCMICRLLQRRTNKNKTGWRVVGATQDRQELMRGSARETRARLGKQTKDGNEKRSKKTGFREREGMPGWL